MWLRSMITHHHGAVRMADTEIATMKRLLAPERQANRRALWAFVGSSPNQGQKSKPTNHHGGCSGRASMRGSGVDLEES